MLNYRNTLICILIKGKQYLYTQGGTMLNIYYGDMPEAIYNTSIYFKNSYEDKWITDDFAREVIRDIDKSEVISAGAVDSPVLGVNSDKSIMAF